MRTSKYLIKGLRFKGIPLWFTVLAGFLWGPRILFADITVLESIVEAERTVHYIGASLRDSQFAKRHENF